MFLGTRNSTFLKKIRARMDRSFRGGLGREGCKGIDERANKVQRSTTMIVPTLLATAAPCVASMRTGEKKPPHCAEALGAARS